MLGRHERGRTPPTGKENLYQDLIPELATVTRSRRARDPRPRTATSTSGYAAATCPATAWSATKLSLPPRGAMTGLGVPAADPASAAPGAIPSRNPAGRRRAGSESSLDPGRRQLLRISAAAEADPPAGNKGRDCAVQRPRWRPATDPRRQPAIRAGEDEQLRSPARNRRRAQSPMEATSGRRGPGATQAREQTDATIGRSQRRSGQSQRQSVRVAPGMKRPHAAGVVNSPITASILQDLTSAERTHLPPSEHVFPGFTMRAQGP